jgi:outer membrane receptor for ferrienterochelin and colicin
MVDVGIKLMHGQAFRAAYGVETHFDLALCCNADGSNQGGLLGNPALKPETITTTDLQYYVGNDNDQFNGTLFYSQQEDLIERQRATNNIQDFVNRGRLKSQAIELEYKYPLIKAPNSLRLTTTRAPRNHQTLTTLNGQVNDTHRNHASSNRFDISLRYFGDGFNHG